MLSAWLLPPSLLLGLLPVSPGDVLALGVKENSVLGGPQHEQVSDGTSRNGVGELLRELEGIDARGRRKRAVRTPEALQKKRGRTESCGCTA